MSTAALETVDSVFHFELPQRPYPGLRPFGKDEWPIFFGRERMIDDVIERLIRQHFLVVHGDSGCGKSSLIRAGVLTRLEQECARAGAHWLTCISAPGEEPLADFARALAELEGNEHLEARSLEIRRLVNCGREGAAPLTEYLRSKHGAHICILIDQFEEIFAHARRHGPQQSRLLVDLLIGLHGLASPRLCVVLTLRSEFLGACAKFEGFAQTVNDTQYLLPRMEHADLMRAIREPAPLYEGDISPDLAERLIADAGGSQDQLPLIQHALMFLHREFAAASGPWRMTLDHYQARGRLDKLLSEHADEVMSSVEPQAASAPTSRVTEDLFRALTDINADGQAIRRPQRLDDLIAVSVSDEPTVRRIIDAFRAEGVSFLRPYGDAPIALSDSIDISHEALIRCWQRLANPGDGWLIREFKNGLVWRSLLVQADSFDNDSKNVLSAATTEERQSWLKRRSEAWSKRYGGDWARVLRLIDASREARDSAEKATLKAQQARLRTRFLALALTLSIALLSLTAYSWYSTYLARGIANSEARRAEQAARELQKSLEETESRRRAAEESLAAIRNDLGGLRSISAAAPADSTIKQTIDQVQSSIAQQVDNLSKATRISPRIYIHIGEESQRQAAAELERRIEAGRVGGGSVVVPGIQLIDTPPPYSLLRCFTAEDCKQYGQPLLDLVNAQIASPKIVLQDFSKTYTQTKSIRPQHFELYFTRGTIALSDAAK